MKFLFRAVTVFVLTAGGASAQQASIQGTVKLEGPAPKAAKISESADPYCTKVNPGGGETEEVVTDGHGGLENVFVYVSAGLSPGQPFETPQEPVTLTQKGCKYEPHVLAVRANQKINIANADKTTHNIHPMPSDNREWNQSQPPGAPLSGAFARQEIAIPVKCNVHPWMKSYIAVFNHPYYAVTGKDGSFELTKLPAGTYTLTAWQEKLGTMSQKITIGTSETKTVQFVFKSR